VRLFLDASVLLAACGSERGASREIFRMAPMHDWWLIATPYVTGEVLGNLADFPIEASRVWVRLRPSLTIVDDVVTFLWPTTFSAGKDKPVLFSAFASADCLLTLDHADFGELLGTSFYGMPVLRPGQFLENERTAGRLREA
jgi:hypothetical protein